MKKVSLKRFHLHRETLRQLTLQEALEAVGGLNRPPNTLTICNFTDCDTLYCQQASATC